MKKIKSRREDLIWNQKDSVQNFAASESMNNHNVHRKSENVNHLYQYVVSVCQTLEKVHTSSQSSVQNSYQFIVLFSCSIIIYKNQDSHLWKGRGCFGLALYAIHRRHEQKSVSQNFLFSSNAMQNPVDIIDHQPRLLD